MARLTFTQNIGAGAVYEPLTGWQYEYAPFGGLMKANFWAAAAGIVVQVSSGSDTLQDRSPVSTDQGAAGEIPSDFDQEPLTDEVAQGDRVKLRFENTTAGAIQLAGYVQYTPG